MTDMQARAHAALTAARGRRGEPLGISAADLAEILGTTERGAASVGGALIRAGHAIRFVSHLGYHRTIMYAAAS